jgi:trk system potassium uptake protein TrkA
MSAANRIVIAGMGRVGLRTAELLDSRGHDVAMIETDPLRVEEVSEAYIGTVVEGDASRPEVLRQAEPGRATAVAALTGHAGTNFAICMLARQLAGVRTVMRADAPGDEGYGEFVDTLVYPEGLGGRAAANAIVGDAVHTVEEMSGDLELLRIRVVEGAPAAGRTLDEVRLPRGSLIVAAEDGDRIGGPETVLEPGRRYLVAVESDVADEVMNLFQG